jgi:dihydrofolate synthase/folylpolyglutamate synthase
MVSAIASVEQAAAYLEGLINLERQPGFSYRRLGLEPIRRLLERLGHPERQLSVVHVAGSKGKGSTALFAESILQALGERVGTFTSPHLERWTERFRIGGEEVVPAALAAAVRQLRPHVDELRLGDPAGAPTFFDATTAAALILFAEAKVDRAILEVGLGGRLDSTNAVEPAVTCITSIELEHTDKLGDSLAAIAGEKAGILKPAVPCVAGSLPEEARRVVRERARDLGSPLFELGRDFEVEVEEGALEMAGARLRYREPDGFELEAAIPVPGAHSAANAALALAALRRLRAHDAARLAEAARRGLAGAALPGRVEVFERRPWVVVDSAHTAASARALGRVLDRIPARRRHLVLSVSTGKSLDAILEALLPGAAAVTATRAEPHRSLDPAELAAAVRRRAPELELSEVADPRRAVLAAREALGGEDLLCVTGSVYLAGIGRGALLRAGREPRARRKGGPVGGAAR